MSKTPVISISIYEVYIHTILKVSVFVPEIKVKNSEHLYRSETKHSFLLKS